MARGRKPSITNLADPAPGGRGAAPQAPEDLSPAALAKWRAIVPMIADLCDLRDTDADALRQYCEAAVLHAKASRELDGQPLTIDTPNGAMMVNPLLKVMRQAEATMMKLSERFGLDPASRKRLAIAQKKSASKLTEFLTRGRGRTAPPVAAE